MKKTIAILSLLRLKNVGMAIVGVLLGHWLSMSLDSCYTLLLLCLATIASLGFGNIINDIFDIEGDKINHPMRPIPAGAVSKKEAIYYSIILIMLAVIASVMVSTIHLFATVAPLLLLYIYAKVAKGIPLAGNIMVSMMVAYTLFYGAINAPQITIVIIPALLAFTLNFCREIIKDIQDQDGDFKTGIKTTATLQNKIIITILITLWTIYLLLFTVPYFLNHFSNVYIIICFIAILPIHIFWLVKLLRINTMPPFKHISMLLKSEMILGLAALALDKGFAPIVG